MTSSAVPTGADDDRGTTCDTKATRGGAAPEKRGGAEHLPLARIVCHARSKVSGYSADGAEGVGKESTPQRNPNSSPGDGSLRRSHPGDEAGETRAGVQLSVARTVGQARSKVSGSSAGGAESSKMSDTDHETSTDVERKTSNEGDSRGGGSDVFGPEMATLGTAPKYGQHSPGSHLSHGVNSDSVQSAEPSFQQNLHRTQSGGGPGSESDERRSPQAPRRRRTGVRGRQQDEHVRLAFNGTTPSPEAVFAYRAARRAERFEAETAERGSSGGQLPTARQPTSRVHRVADFAKWADQVAEAAKADAAAASTTFDWREERRRRKSAVHTAPTGEAEDDLKIVSVDRPTPRSAAKTREEYGSAASASYPGDESLRRSYPGDEDSSGPGIQVGARERRTAPAGHGFRVSATVDDVAGESEQNDDEHQQRLLEAAAQRARRSPDLSDDETRKRRRGPTQDRGRRTFGSRQLERLQSAMSAFHFEPPEAATEGESRRRPGSHDDSSWETGSSFDDRGKRRAHGSKAAARSALKTSRQRQRWIHQLDALGVLPQGEGRIGSIRSLGAQRQRADAYAAAAARAAPG